MFQNKNLHVLFWIVTDLKEKKIWMNWEKTKRPKRKSEGVNRRRTDNNINMTNNHLQNTIQKTRDRATRTPIKNRGEVRFFGRISRLQSKILREVFCDVFSRHYNTGISSIVQCYDTGITNIAAGCFILSKYLSISLIVWVWEHKYNMYANIIKLIWVETPSNRGSPFLSVLPDWLDYLQFRMPIRIKFQTRLDILRVSLGIWMISYSHSRIMWKPLISNHLQIKYFNQ
jgi:hypothetical protein